MTYKVFSSDFISCGSRRKLLSRSMLSVFASSQGRSAAHAWAGPPVTAPQAACCSQVRHLANSVSSGRILLEKEQRAFGSIHQPHLTPSGLCFASKSIASSNRGSATTAIAGTDAGFHQERIGTDGSLSTSSPAVHHQQKCQQHAAANTSRVIMPSGSPHEQRIPTVSGSQSSNSNTTQTVTRPPSLPAAAPMAPPVSQQQLTTLVNLIQGSSNVLVVTGAGCSTESNIPDYRGPTGAYTTGFTPMTHQQFMAKPESRARYWSRSFAGWHEFAHVQPNTAHEGLARLQQMGWVGQIITQNVDRLHQKGGSSKVLELHGTTHRVVCMDCGDFTARCDFQNRLADLNPGMAARVQQMATAATSAGINNRSAYQRALRAGTTANGRRVKDGEDAEQVPVVRPDGDIELRDAGFDFKVPTCTKCCSDKLKPDVVFFGDSVPKERVQEALSAAKSADLVLVVGSSLMVWSAFRLVKVAHEAGARVAIVNVGPTRADDIANLKVEALAGEVMMQLAMHPSSQVPRLQ